MNIVQCLSHAVEEFDMLKLYARLGVNVFSVGGYIDPAHPHDDKRPGVPEMPFFPELRAAIDVQQSTNPLGEAQEHLPDALLDWADVIVYHHYLDRLYDQWGRIGPWLRADSAHRVIWRTVGQSVENNERAGASFRNDGMEIVRYSPKEANIPGYAGADALIRFAKDPADWYGWTGEDAVVGNVTQELLQRDPWTNARFWLAATEGLPVRPAGPGSEHLPGGIGALAYDEMREYLRRCRAYLYTGTQPASYTLGLIEAMMTGIPVVSIGPKWFDIFEEGEEMFEGHALTFGYGERHDDPATAHEMLRMLLEPDEFAGNVGGIGRFRAIELFGIDTIASQWAEFLDVKVPVTA